METHKYSTHGTTPNKLVCWKYGQGQIQKICVESNIETKDKKVERKKSSADIFIHGNKKHNNVSREISRDYRIQNEDVRSNLCSSNDGTNMWSNHKPYYM